MARMVEHTDYSNAPVNPSAGGPDARSRLIRVIAAETGVSPARLSDDTALADDLGVAGLDGADLLQAIGAEFELDLSAVDWPAYFGEESAFDPLRAIWRKFIDQDAASEAPPLRISDLLHTIESGGWRAPRG